MVALSGRTHSRIRCAGPGRRVDIPIVQMINLVVSRTGEAYDTREQEVRIPDEVFAMKSGL
jgi:hypothetical protein